MDKLQLTNDNGGIDPPLQTPKILMNFDPLEGVIYKILLQWKNKFFRYKNTIYNSPFTIIIY